MSKYKLPGKEEIRKRASIIVDKADIFEEFNTGSVYDEIMPVKKVKGSFSRVFIPAVLAIAAIVLIFNTDSFKNSELGQALKPSQKPEETLPDETKVYKDRGTEERDKSGDGSGAVTGGDSYFKITSQRNEINVEGEKYNTTLSATIDIPMINNEEKIELSSRLRIMYSAMALNGSYIADEEAGKIAELASVAEDTLITGRLTVADVTEDYGLINDTCMSIIIQEKYDYEVAGSENKYYKYNTSGKVYNVKTDKCVELRTVAEDYSTLIDEIADVLYEEVQKADNFAEQYPTIEVLKQQMKKTENWSLSDEGLVWYLNLDEYVSIYDKTQQTCISATLKYTDAKNIRTEYMK